MKIEKTVQDDVREYRTVGSKIRDLLYRNYENVVREGLGSVSEGSRVTYDGTHRGQVSNGIS